MAREKFTQSEITAAIGEMNKKLEKKNQKIVALGTKIESINKMVESRVAEKKKCDNAKKQLETENDLLQIKTLRELCGKANIPMQEVFAAAFKALMEKVSNQADGKKQEDHSDMQAAEKTAEDVRDGKIPASSDYIKQKENEKQNVNHRDNENLLSRNDTETDTLVDHDSENSPPEKDKGKPLNPVEKAKMEQRERLAQKQADSPLKPTSGHKSSLEEKLSPYMGR